MEIVDLKEEHLEALCDVYNAGVARVPHCYPVDVDRFRTGLATVLGEAPERERLKRERVLVAIDGEVPVGYVHLGDHHQKNGQIPGAIRFLAYPVGRRPVGQALLEEAIAHHSEKDRIFAFHQNYRYGFYHRSCAYLSDRMGHVQSLLQMNGFERSEGEIHFDWDGFDVDPGDPPLEVEIRPKTGDETDHRKSFRIGVWQGDEEIAACEMCACGRWTNEPSEQDRLFVTWLGVEREYQGRKLGQYALLYAMRAAKELGYVDASISTAVSNHRAFLFYSNIGFHVTDMTYMWVLDQGPASNDPPLRQALRRAGK